jgi:hypothetical protein
MKSIVKFDQSQKVAIAETASSAVAAQAKAVIEARYIVAMNNPRDMDDVRQKVLRECQRPRFAEVARYRKPIGQGVEGPSIRFAEAAIRCMGNIVVETMTVYDDAEKRIVRVSVTDLEANVPYSQDVTIHKTVERRNPKDGDEVLKSRQNSQGKTVYILVATDDDILNKQNALISKAIRTLGMRLIPGDIVDEAMETVIETNLKKDSADPDAARKRLFDAFSGLGIAAGQLKEYLGHEASVLSQREIEELRGLYAAMKDGETTWHEIMDARAPKAEPEQKPTPGSKKQSGISGLKSKIAKISPVEQSGGAEVHPDAQNEAGTPDPRGGDVTPTTVPEIKNHLLAAVEVLPPSVKAKFKTDILHAKDLDALRDIEVQIQDRLPK